MSNYMNLFQELYKSFPDDISLVEGKEYIVFRKDIVLPLFNEIKYNTDYKFLLDVTATDYPEYFQVVYHVMNLTDGDIVRLNADLPKGEVDDYSINSIESIWKSANVMEREVYDLMGIIFENHPNLKKILTDDNFIGHPLRKDYILPKVDRE